MNNTRNDDRDKNELSNLNTGRDHPIIDKALFQQEKRKMSMSMRQKSAILGIV